MNVEVVDPEEYMGDVIGDLQRAPRPHPRHGASAATAQVIAAEVPLATMFGYVDRPPVDDAGPRDVHDAVLALRAGPAHVQRRSSSSSCASARDERIERGA